MRDPTIRPATNKSCGPIRTVDWTYTAKFFLEMVQDLLRHIYIHIHIHIHIYILIGEMNNHKSQQSQLVWSVYQVFDPYPGSTEKSNPAADPSVSMIHQNLKRNFPNLYNIYIYMYIYMIYICINIVLQDFRYVWIDIFDMLQRDVCSPSRNELSHQFHGWAQPPSSELQRSEWNLNSFFGNNPSSVTRCPESPEWRPPVPRWETIKAPWVHGSVSSCRSQQGVAVGAAKEWTGLRGKPSGLQLEDGTS